MPVDPERPELHDREITPAAALEVRETGGARDIAGLSLLHLWHAHYRVLLAGFTPPAAGTTVTLELHRPPSTAFGLAGSRRHDHRAADRAAGAVGGRPCLSGSSGHTASRCRSRGSLRPTGRA